MSQGKTTVYAPGRVDYLDLLSFLNFLTMAEALTTATLRFHLYFERKLIHFTLTMPNVLENNPAIRYTPPTE